MKFSRAHIDDYKLLDEIGEKILLAKYELYKDEEDKAQKTLDEALDLIIKGKEG